MASAGTPQNGTKNAANITPPDGTWVNQNSPASAQNFPVVLYDSRVYWPLSYRDNRYSYAIVVTDSSYNILDTFEAPGGRYIAYIIVETAPEVIYFVGQAGATSNVSWSSLLAAANGQTTTAGAISSTILSHSVSSGSGPPATLSPGASSTSITPSQSATAGGDPYTVPAEIGSIIGAIFGFLAIVVAIYYGQKQLRAHHYSSV